MAVQQVLMAAPDIQRHADMPGRSSPEADPTLIERARTDRAAFGQLYDLYLERVFRFCLARTGDVQVAQDITGDVFERALKALIRPGGGYEWRGVKFSAWLLRIAANCVVSHWRAPKREFASTAPVSDQAAGYTPDQRPLIAESPDPQVLLARWERASELRARISLLPDDHQRVLRFRYWDERGWDEVGRRMGCGEEAAKKKGQRALSSLRVLLDLDRLLALPPMLPEHQQRAAQLRFVEGYTLEAVAREMRRPSQSVEHLLERALKGLAKKGAKQHDQG
jgi:RNA polymerase sigma-70 factor (ECF subfamily)